MRIFVPALLLTLLYSADARSQEVRSTLTGIVVDGQSIPFDAEIKVIADCIEVDLMKTEIPEDYAIDGESFWPFLMSGKRNHRKWVYGYRGPQQLIRGRRVMKDGFDKWWDVSTSPEDLISFPQIDGWQAVSPEHRNERNRFREILPNYDLWEEAHDAPGTPPAQPTPSKAR